MTVRDVLILIRMVGLIPIRVGMFRTVLTLLKTMQPNGGIVILTGMVTTFSAINPIIVQIAVDTPLPTAMVVLIPMAIRILMLILEVSTDLNHGTRIQMGLLMRSHLRSRSGKTRMVTVMETIGMTQCGMKHIQNGVLDNGWKLLTNQMPAHSSLAHPSPTVTVAQMQTGMHGQIRGKIGRPLMVLMRSHSSQHNGEIETMMAMGITKQKGRNSSMISQTIQHNFEILMKMAGAITRPMEPLRLTTSQ